MKKLIAVLIIMSIMLCACGQQEKTPSKPTQEPTKEVTQEPTQEPTQEVTLEPTQEPTKEPTLTQELTQVPTENESTTIICEWCEELPADHIYQGHCFCTECYTGVLRNEAEVTNYNAILEAAAVASTDIDVITDLTSMGKAQIIINADGISFKNASASLLIALQSVLPDIMDIRIYQDCEIDMEVSNGGVLVTKAIPPLYWLDYIG